MTKDLIDAIRGRRSVRSFTDDPISDATLQRILECGRLAPSAGNMEPWFFYVVKNPEVKKQLAQVSEAWIDQAPVVILVTADYRSEESRFGDKGYMYLLQDTAAATQNMLLAAYGYGIGSCWVGDFQVDEVKRILKLREGEQPVVMIPLGYPADEKTADKASNTSLEEKVKVIH